MKRKWQKRLLVGTLALAITSTNVMPAMAKAAPDGKTNAAELSESMGLTDQWNAWVNDWESVKTDWTQISLTPGANESELNFAWYSRVKKEIVSDNTVSPNSVSAEEGDSRQAPVLKIGEGRGMNHAKEYVATQTEVESETDAEGNTYVSNKVTATGLKAGTTYYYSYQKEDGAFTEPVAYTTKSTDQFSFIFVGDPQIGSSNELKGQDTQEFYDAQSAAVRSDAFNWETTLNAAMEKTGRQASFVVSAGDQIQTTKKKAPNKNPANSEIEYAGYLSPDILKSLPVATSVGNHDADNANYTYHFNTPNNSELGSNGVVGGDYYFTYNNALFMMLNTQDTEVEEHKTFIKQTVKANPDCTWRIVTLHQDIYGSAEHSNEPEITNLRYQLVPSFEENDIDVVLTGHDHAYSRSKMLLGGKQTEAFAQYTDDEFDAQLEKDMDAGENPETLYTAPGNIQDGTTDPDEQKYLQYLRSIMDDAAIEQVKTESEAVINPDGILYMTASSSSGSKYYDLVPRTQSYIAGRWQGDVPTYSIATVTEDTFSISTYRTDNGEKIDDTFTIAKMDIDKSQLRTMVDGAKKNEVATKDSYTKESWAVFEQAINGAQTVLDDPKAINSEVKAAILALTNAKASLAKNEVKEEVKENTGDDKKENKPEVKAININSATVAKMKKQTYNGKKLTPSVTVTAGQKTLKEGTDYTVSYSNNKNTGKATVTITGIGEYAGTKEVSFDIAPKKLKVKSVKAVGHNKAKVTITKAAGKVSGYEITYATNKNFKKAAVKRTTKTTYTLKSLSSEKTYYVKVRAYKTVSGKKIYGSYSKTYKVKIK